MAARPRPRRRPACRRSSTSWRNTSRICRSRIRTRRSRWRTGQQPQIAIQINVNAKPLQGNDIEVELKLDGKAETGGNNLMFSFELVYAGVFRIQNVPQEAMNPIVLIECPRLLFPFAREIIATTVRNGGFPPLLLDPVDFVGLYRKKLAEMQAAGTRRRRSLTLSSRVRPIAKPQAPRRRAWR